MINDKILPATGTSILTGVTTGEIILFIAAPILFFVCKYFYDKYFNPSKNKVLFERVKRGKKYYYRTVRDNDKSNNILSNLKK